MQEWCNKMLYDIWHLQKDTKAANCICRAGKFVHKWLHSYCTCHMSCDQYVCMWFNSEFYTLFVLDLTFGHLLCSFASHGWICRNVERPRWKTGRLFVAWSLFVQPGKGVLLREWAADAWREERGVLLTRGMRETTRWLLALHEASQYAEMMGEELGLCSDSGVRRSSREISFFTFECFHFSGSHQKALAWTEFYAKGHLFHS